MRLYNPNFGKESEKTLKRKSRRNHFVTALIWLAILAAIGGLICCIVFKAKWYFYLGDIGGGLILPIILCFFYAKKELKYIDIPVEETEEQYVQRNLRELTPEKVLSNVMRREGDGALSGCPYKGIWQGIAVCECGHVFDLKQITYDVSNRSSVHTSDANSNMQFYETANLQVTCHCPKCGQTHENMFYNVKRSTGSVKRKQELFSDHTTVTTTSYDADYAGYVEDRYQEDLKQHKADCEKYKKIIKQKTTALRNGFKSHHDLAQRQIEELRAKGWYEKNK